MNYIVFDLEWNQCPYGKNREVRELPFEIIEIGAVKLDADRNYVDSYERIVRPSVYKTLHYRTREIVHMDAGTLKKGMWFPDAVREFLSWAGHDSVFCTWGTVDLTELQRNMNYYHLLHLLKGPLHYYDVQKLFAIQYETMEKRRSLESAVDFLQIKKERDFHRADADAWYTAKLFQTVDMDVVMAYDSIDAYQNPKTKTEEIHTVYNGYSKYISREFADKEAAMRDPEVVATHCCRCGKKARKKIRWFSVNARNYYCVALCPEHGLLKGKIRMKHTDGGHVYVVKTIKISSEPEAAAIREKRNGLREKRHRKRQEDLTRKEASLYNPV